MMIPDNITQFDSSGEKIIYLKFKNEPSSQKYYVLHSLFTNHHLTSLSGELDFLVLAPGLGIFALEIKHGRVRREGGTWYFEDRYGKVNTSHKGPFRQVSDTMHSVRNFILKKFKEGSEEHKRFERLLFGNGVIFTGLQDFTDFGTEAHPWQVLTRSVLNLPISYYIDALARGWHDRKKNKSWYDANMAKPTDKDCKRIIEIIRGDIDINYTAVNKIADQEFLIEEYTKEQFHLLDFVKYNDRCLIEGQAGTGKTLMALEIARRTIQEGKTAALFCFNNQLGKKLAADMASMVDVSKGGYYAGSLHSFLLTRTGLKVPGEDKELFFRETLPLEFLLENEGMPESEKFDLLIFDEAQDMISPYNLEVFNYILKGGLKSGKWILFGDFSRQSIFLDNIEDRIRELSSTANFVRFPPLIVNCRNTSKIAKCNVLLTGCELPKYRINERAEDDINLRFPVKNKVNQCIEDIIQGFLAEDIPLSKVTVLAPKSFENTHLSQSEYLSELFRSQRLAFSTVQAFKGLENTIIIVTGFEELQTEDAQKLLYVAVSRAKLRLYLVLNDKLRSQYDQLISKNANKILV